MNVGVLRLFNTSYVAPDIEINQIFRFIKLHHAVCVVNYDTQNIFTRHTWTDVHSRSRVTELQRKDVNPELWKSKDNKELNFAAVKPSQIFISFLTQH